MSQYNDYASYHNLDQYYRRTATPAAPTPAANQSWEITKGLKSGIDQVQALGAGGVAWLGDVLGSDRLVDWGLESYQKNMSEAQENAARVGSYEDVESIGDAVDYVMHGLGNALPMLIPSVVSGGVGAIAARKAAQKGVEHFLKNRIQKGVASGLTQRAATKLAAGQALKGEAMGATLGTSLASIGLETGSIFGETYEHTGETHAGVAISHGTVAGLLDAIPVGRLLNRMGIGDQATKQISKKVQESAKSFIGKQVLTEAGTEGLQTIIERHAVKWVDENKEIFSDEGWSEIVNAAILGGVAGGAISTPAAIATHSKQKILVRQENKRLEIEADASKSLEDILDTSMDDLNATAESLLNDNAIINKNWTTPDFVVDSEGNTETIKDPQASFDLNANPIDVKPAIENQSQTLVDELQVETIDADKGAELNQEALLDKQETQAAETSFETEIPTTQPELNVEDNSDNPELQATPSGETAIKNVEIEAKAQKVNTEPTEAQKEAGNYKKAHIKIQGLDIAIENPKGSNRTGTSPDGKKWSTKMNQHYGYFKRSEGADGDHVDVFVGDKVDSDQVFVVDQVNADGSFDEHKVMLGFDSEKEAVDAYKSNYQKGWKVGPVTSMSSDEFKVWLKDGDTKNPATPATEPPLQVEKLSDKELINEIDKVVGKGKDRLDKDPLASLAPTETQHLSSGELERLHQLKMEYQKRNQGEAGRAKNRIKERIAERKKRPLKRKIDSLKRKGLDSGVLWPELIESWDEINGYFHNESVNIVGMSDEDYVRKLESAIETKSANKEPKKITKKQKISSKSKRKRKTTKVKGVAEENTLYSDDERRAGKIPNQGQKHRPSASVYQAGRREAQLFIREDGEPEEVKKQLTDIYQTQVGSETVRHLNSTTNTVNSPEDLAEVIRDIGRKAQETFLAIVTDKKGKILRVIHHTSGLKDASPIDSVTVAAEVASIKNADTVHFAHNHPSGTPRPSDSDLGVTAQLEVWLEGTGIKFGYHAIATPEKRTVIFSNDYNHYVLDAPIKTRKATKKIPVTERFIQENRQGTQVTSPDAAKKLISAIESDDAVVLLNTQAAPVGVVFLSADEMKALRDNGNANRLMAAIDKTNASRFFLKSNDLEAANNLIRFFNREPLRGAVLDWFYKGAENQYISSAESQSHLLRQEGDFYRLSNGAKGIDPKQVEKTKAIFSRLFEGAPINVAFAESDLPDRIKEKIQSDGKSGRVKGLFVDGQVYIVGEAHRSVADLTETILHETVAHYGLKQLLGSEHQAFIDQVYRLLDTKTKEDIALRHQLALDNKTAIAEEFLAEIAESNPNPTILDKIINFFMRSLRAIFPNLSLSKSELKAVLAQSRQYLMSRKSTPHDQITIDTSVNGNEIKGQADIVLRRALKHRESLFKLLECTNS